LGADSGSLNFGRSGFTVNMQWVPSHVGVAGNEKADYLAKMGTSCPQPAIAPTLSSAKGIIEAAVRSKVKNDHWLKDNYGSRW
jgi:hypothetical protein